MCTNTFRAKIQANIDHFSHRKATNAGPLDKILHGSVGYLTPRSGGMWSYVAYLENCLVLVKGSLLKFHFGIISTGRKLAVTCVLLDGFQGVNACPPPFTFLNCEVNCWH